MHANPVVDHQAKKADPNQIYFMARGDLIQYDSKLSVPTANINMAKLHWNSVISTALAKYICIDTEKFTCQLHWITMNT
jgi:hypothetical protein